MNLENAVTLIRRAVEEMSALYGKPVFNEWAVINLVGTKIRILHYEGPRRDEFRNQFPGDLTALRAELLGTEHPIGDFEFARNAQGTHFDSFMKLGARIYLLCNHTERTIHQITRESDWLKAQRPFLEMSEGFRQDPVVEPEGEG